MSARIIPSYNPQILPVRAEALAAELQAIADDVDPNDVNAEQLEFLNTVHWVKDLSDAVLVRVIAEAVPETSLTVEDIYRVEDWDELVMLVFEEHLDDPVRDLFKQMSMDGHIYEIPVPANPPTSSPSFAAGDEMISEELTYETVTVERMKYGAETRLCDLSPEAKSINTLAKEMADVVMGDLVDILPDTDESQQGEEPYEVLLGAFKSIRNDGGEPDSIVVDSTGTLSNPQTSNYDEYKRMLGVKIEQSDHLPAETVVVADSDRMGCEGVWESGKVRVHEPPIRSTDLLYSGTYPSTEKKEMFSQLTVDYRQATNGVVISDDFVEICRL